ncbi:MAG: metallophosphoesterase family protein [Candidatus Woesearchaeota archaeon]
MKFLVVGDLHGQTPRIPDVEFDAVIVPGDVCSDEGIKPLMMQAVQARKDGEEVVDWWDVVSRKEARRLLDHSLSEGRSILEMLNSLGVPIFAIPGNWDWTGYEDASWKYLRSNLWEKRVVSGLENVIDCDGSLVTFEEITFVGYGRCNGPELVGLRGYADVSESEVLESELEFEELFTFYSELFSQANKPTIFLAHNVPYGTSLDVIVNPDNPMDGMHYGSILVTELIKEFSPLITIGGHMHEHYGTDEVEGSVCLNAGFGSDKATIVEIVDGEVSVTKL